ncbi:Clr5 domain-containing protein [Nemania sp. FL0031]|nr:Clr5 domain-containing protein [Nemania sp. FL0031]
MALNRISTPWAQTEDWARHRTIIADLYVKQGKKMKDVMRTMEDNYGFHATRRMYKTRFKKWGLVKHPKSNSACSESHCPRPIVSANMPTPKRGVGQITNDVSVPNLQDLWVPSSIPSIAPPDCYKFAEITFHSTQVYFSSIGSLGLGLPVSDKKLVTATACAEWLDCVITAKALLTFGYSREAVLLIDLCCHQYRPLLDSQDPSLMAVTIACVLKVVRYWPDLAKTFLNFICTMSQIVLGAPHPLTTVFQKFKEAGICHLAYCIYMTLRQFIGGIVHVMPHPMMDSYGDFYGDMIHGKFIDTNTTLGELQILQNRFQGRPQRQPNSQPSPPEEAAAIQCRIASLCYYGKRYEDATEWALRMLNEPLVSAHVATGCYDILHDVAVAENKYELALENIQKAVDTSVEAYGRFHYSTIRKTARLEACLRRMGRLQEASEVQLDLEAQVARMCEKIRSLRL